MLRGVLGGHNFNDKDSKTVRVELEKHFDLIKKENWIETEDSKFLPSQLYLDMDMFKKKVALRDIAKIEKSQIFVLFENEASIKIFFAHKCFASCSGYFV